MANTELTLESIRTVIRDEIASVKNDVTSLKSDVATLKGDVRELDEKVDRVKTMLEEDFMAGAMRIDRLERQVRRTRSELKQHIETHS